jgi:ubiquinone/menaquinone biosynthesis C-methylase UbiE
MGDVPAEVRRHYEHEIDEAIRITEGIGQLELYRTRELVRRHLPSGSLRVLDVGGAAGVHAQWLAGDGHHVHLVDPMRRHVDQARRLAPTNGSIAAELGDARELPARDESFDAVLVLGPLYHLTEKEDRIGALSEARRVARPGAPIFVAGISRFASLFDGLSREFLFDPAFRAIVDHDLRDGQHRNSEARANWFTTAYFHHPDELEGEARAAGLEVVELLGVEGLAGWLPHLGDRWSDETDRETILVAARATEAEPALRGLSAHLLLVARRP